MQDDNTHNQQPAGHDLGGIGAYHGGHDGYDGRGGNQGQDFNHILGKA